MQSPVTLGLIAVTALVSWLAFKDRRLIDRLILWPPALSERHEYWRLISYGFLHADLSHLLFNMITLFFFGQLIERVMAQFEEFCIVTQSVREGIAVDVTVIDADGMAFVPGTPSLGGAAA